MVLKAAFREILDRRGHEVSSLYTALVSRVLFPVHERLKGHDTVRVLREMERTQWRSPGELRALQLARLREYLLDVQQHVPVWRELFQDIGFDPAGMESLDDLRRLPLTDKAFIRENTERLKADDARGLARFNTGDRVVSR